MLDAFITIVSSIIEIWSCKKVLIILVSQRPT